MCNIFLLIIFHIASLSRCTCSVVLVSFGYHRDNADGSYTVAQAAVDFELPEELISTLLDIARSPLLVEDKDNLDLKLAK